jgi:hypothetical protein
VVREPCQKGVSVLPLVAGLKAHPEPLKLVPEELWRYFDDHIAISGWYPERDYFVLIEALAKTIDPNTVGGDVWRFFARFSAQRDIAGAEVTGDGESDTKGLLQNFMSLTPIEPALFFRRARRLWSEYHDTGTMQVRGGRVKTNSVVLQLVGFNIPIEGFVRLQGYYLEEYGRLVGHELESKVTQSTVRGDPFCEWECFLTRTPESEAYVASLPALLP